MCAGNEKAALATAGFGRTAYGGASALAAGDMLLRSGRTATVMSVTGAGGAPGYQAGTSYAALPYSELTSNA